MEQKTLRSGYTTGTCAAAAAKAAAVFRLTGICPAMAEVGLPSGKRVCLETEEWEEHSVRVKKDAGDDPDVTHGAWIYAGVSEISRNRLDELKTSGSGYWLEAYPQLYLSGGAGIGRVTKPGLSCPVGHYAINPVPRQMILAAVDEAARRAAFDGCLMVEIRIPDGERLAEMNF